MHLAGSVIAGVRSSVESLAASDGPTVMMIVAVVILLVAGRAISVLFRSLLAVVSALLAPLFSLVWLFGFAVLLLLGAAALGFFEQPPARG